MVLSEEHIAGYREYLRELERSEATVRKYTHDLRALLAFLRGRAVTKPLLIEWKAALAEDYAPATVNAMIATANGLLAFVGLGCCAVKPLRIQSRAFCDESRELTRAEYARLVKTAAERGDERLALAIQTICATGIRVSELRFITAEAVRAGRVEVANKGKRRSVFLPGKLRRVLDSYLRRKKISSRSVFVTRTGRPLDRSNIWRDMKRLCSMADVSPEKVFPHNLRHLFARTHYSLEKDLSRLADILGHSSVTTTRIYTAESGAVHARQIGRLNLVVT